MTIVQFGLINLGALIAAFGGIFLKRLSLGMQEPAFSLEWAFDVLTNRYIWLGGLCYVLPIFIWAYLLRSMELTKLQPLLSIVYIYTIVLSYCLLGEQLIALRLIGIAFVVFGVILVGRT
jgi:drug/metabolite transporter (DMT)-like permease